MSTEQQIREDMKEAMRAKDGARVTTLRGLLSAFTNELVAQKRKPTDTLDEKDVLAVIKRAVKQRKDSIEQFANGGRDDLVAKEQAELDILDAYLPEMLGKAEIEKIAKAKIDEMGVADKSNVGQLMGAIMKECAGNADGETVKEVVESLLA